MHSLLQDVAYGFRSMRRNVVASTTAIVVLALGIGANAAVFSVVNKVLLEPLPYPAADRLVQIFCDSPMGPVLVTSVPKFVTWREQPAYSSTWPHSAPWSRSGSPSAVHRT